MISIQIVINTFDASIILTQSAPTYSTYDIECTLVTLAGDKNGHFLPIGDAISTVLCSFVASVIYIIIFESLSKSFEFYGNM